MKEASLPFREEIARTAQRAGNDAVLMAWLHRSLSRQYDAVLDEDLPPVIAAVARKYSDGH